MYSAPSPASLPNLVGRFEELLWVEGQSLLIPEVGFDEQALIMHRAC